MGSISTFAVSAALTVAVYSVYKSLRKRAAGKRPGPKSRKTIEVTRDPKTGVYSFLRVNGS